MRHQGKIFNWKDEQGYGFVIPNGGGDKAFVHIKSFVDPRKRPVDGDLITYEITRDNNAKLKATNIKFVRDSKVSSNQRNKLGNVDLLLMVGLIAFLIVERETGKVSDEICYWYLLISFVTFLIYCKDKLAAKFSWWRTSEYTLHLLSLIGGWPGAIIAHRLLRHKSVKKEFRTGFWITVLINIVIFGYLITTGLLEIP
jgi:uncharacterized membrane protein YsdA (DUF1294 family)/cold shock CspA family protein